MNPTLSRIYVVLPTVLLSSAVTTFAYAETTPAVSVAETPTPATPSLDERRLALERAEAELHLREREARVERANADLDRTASPDTGSAASARASEAHFSRAGRIVLPELAGVASFGTLGAPGVSYGLFMSGLFSVRSESVDNDGQRSNWTSLSFRPSVDVFVTDRWTVGLAVDALRSRYRNDASANTAAVDGIGYTIAATPRVGRTFDAGPVTIWPKIGAGYGVSRDEENVEGGESGRTLRRTFSVLATLDVVVPLTKNILFDVGPALSYRSSSAQDGRPSRSYGDVDSLDFGLRAHLGATF